MKKLCIIIVNIILIVVVLISYDMYVYYKTSNESRHYQSVKSFLNIYSFFYKEQFRKKDNDYFLNQYIYGKTAEGKDFYRKVVNPESSLKPILLFGCSFVYGYKIPESAIASEVFGRYTNRPVYNRAQDGLGVNLMLYQLQNEEFYKIIPEPQYIIYNFIDDHPRRMYETCVPFVNYYYDIFYKIKNNKVVQTKYLNKFYSVEELKKKYYFHKIKEEKFREKQRQLLLLQLIECNNLIKQHWPDSEFIIFVYTNDDSLLGEIKGELEQNGIRIIYRKDIAPYDDYDVRFSLSNKDLHPNEHAWEYIVPKLMKEIEND